MRQRYEIRYEKVGPRYKEVGSGYNLMRLDINFLI